MFAISFMQLKFPSRIGSFLPVSRWTAVHTPRPIGIYWPCSQAYPLHVLDGRVDILLTHPMTALGHAEERKVGHFM